MIVAAAVVGACVLFASLNAASAPAPHWTRIADTSGSCLEDLRRARLALLTAAEQSMSSGSALSSLRIYEQQLQQDQFVLTHEDCTRPLDPTSQRTDLTEAARKYICSAQALNCAIRRVDDSTTTQQCNLVTNACMQEYPAPR